MSSTNTPKPKTASAIKPNDFFEAAGNGDLDTVREYVELQPELVNACDKGGLTALHYAASAGEAEVVKFLTENKANINAKNKNGDTPFHMAVFAKHMGIAKDLRANGGVG